MNDENTGFSHRPAHGPRASNHDGATWRLAGYALTARLADFPADVRAEGVRALVNWAGCVLGAVELDSVATAREALAAYSGPEEASLIGSRRRANRMHAALVNGMAATGRVFDDTYLEAVVHPTSPVGAAAFAAGEMAGASGPDLIAAIIIGDEICCRAASMLTRPPGRSHLGLYMTGVAGGIGAAAAAGRLMGLGEQEMVWALGIAASQASGLRALHGTRNTALMAGNAARAGVMAAILAKAGLTSGEQALEGPRGFADIFASPPNIAAATDGLGESYEIRKLTYKPYPCGIVAHAVVDAALRIARGHKPDPDQIERVEVELCPEGVELTGIRHPVDHMNSRNSLHHWAAVALMCRRATILEEELIHDPKVRALRDRIHASAADMGPDAARVRVILKDGSAIEEWVEHCVGSHDRPMTDEELDEKFMGQAPLSLGEDRAKAALAACRAVEGIDDMKTLVAALCP